MRFVFALLGVWMAASSLVGCKKPVAAPRPGPPPLRVSFRKSQIPTEGMVAGINNTSTSESVKEVVVFVRSKNEKEERSYRIDREIKPLDSVSVGWIQLNGWKLKSGDKLRIRCEGYTDDLESEVPD